jgi:hypothetical protein
MMRLMIINAAGADDPDFYSAETNVDTKLTNVLQADPILEASTIQEGPATVLTTGGTNQLRESGLYSNHEIPGVCPSPPNQLIDWMNQALTVLSCGEEQASPSYNVNFKVRKQSTLLQPSYSHCSIANGFSLYHIAPIKLHDMLGEMETVECNSY